jgi:GNAT superfamily N-acetyltransferase
VNDPIRLFHLESDADFDRAFPVMVQLRPHLTPGSFRARGRRQMTQGYKLAALEAGGRIRSLGGYRVCDFLHSGRTLYIDDLVTDEASRSRGHGEQLFQWLREIAAIRGCTELHLDSGVQRSRAHRFYFRQGMHVDDFHFAMRLALPGTIGGAE